MANVGEQLKEPESGMKRIPLYKKEYLVHFDNMGKRSRDYAYDKNVYYDNDEDEISGCDIWVMAKKVKIIAVRHTDGATYATCTFNDDKIDNFSCYNSSGYVKCVIAGEYESEDKQVIKISIKKSEASKGSYLYLDCIDLDDDGEILYRNNDGKLYYDVTPVMTSNTAPEGYEVSASSNYGGNYAPYKAFDGVNNVESTGWKSASGITKNQYITLKNKDITIISNLMITTVKNGYLEAPKRFDIQGSNDNSQWITLSSYNVSDWSRNEGGFDTKLFKALGKYQYYRLFIYETNGSTNVASLSELRYLLAVDTPFFLIEDNGVYYNLDEDNNLVQVNDISKLDEPALTNECIYDVNKILEVKDSLSANAKIISNKSYNLIKNRIYSTDEMVIANGNIVTRIMAEIQQILGIYDLDGNCSIKMVASEDDGATWLTTPDNGSIWDTLDNTVDLSVAYKDMTNEQKTQWNSLMEEIKMKGYDITTLSTIDYNRFDKNVNGIRHAYVISIVDANSVAIAKELQMKFNAFGDYVQMAVGTEVNIRQSDTTIVVTPTNDTEDLLVNIGLSSDRAIDGGGGSSEEFTYTTSDVDNIINGL